MITAAILSIVYYLLYFNAYLFLLMPDITANEQFASAVHTAMSYAQAINNIFPVSELLFSIMGVFLAYEIAYAALKIFNWVIRKIPGIN